MLWVPALRLVEIVDANRTIAFQKNSSIYRRMSELRSGRQEFVSLDTADRILTELNLNHFLHIPPENGGLADIYVDEKQYGKPDNHRAFDKPRVKYETHEDRLAARRRTWRESKQRKKAA